MKFLIIEGSIHHKNKEALYKILDNMGVTYKEGRENNIEDYDIIYMPSTTYDSSKYPDKKFIFGPHLSVFPNNELLKINNKNKNSVYIQPSEWVAKVWKNMGVENVLPIMVMPFCVNVDKFKPDDKIKKEEVFIYTKRRDPREIYMIEKYLKDNYIKYKIFDYVNSYKEEDYLNCLKKSKYGIIIDAHESQGFAIEEALSCNVPLLVWNTRTMDQEFGSRYKEIECTTIPYWDKRCGEYFYKESDFEIIYKDFINNLDSYKPREYILENLTTNKCTEVLTNIINTLK